MHLCIFSDLTYTDYSVNFRVVVANISLEYRQTETEIKILNLCLELLLVNGPCAVLYDQNAEALPAALASSTGA